MKVRASGQGRRTRHSNNNTIRDHVTQENNNGL